MGKKEEGETSCTCFSFFFFVSSLLLLLLSTSSSSLLLHFASLASPACLSSSCLSILVHSWRGAWAVCDIFTRHLFIFSWFHHHVYSSWGRFFVWAGLGRLGAQKTGRGRQWFNSFFFLSFSFFFLARETH